MSGNSNRFRSSFFPVPFPIWLLVAATSADFSLNVVIAVVVVVFGAFGVSVCVRAWSIVQTFFSNQNSNNNNKKSKKRQEQDKKKKNIEQHTLQCELIKLFVRVTSFFFFGLVHLKRKTFFSSYSRYS